MLVTVMVRVHQALCLGGAVSAYIHMETYNLSTDF